MKGTGPMVLLQLDPMVLGGLRAVVVALLGAVALAGGAPLVQAVFRRVDRESRLMAERRAESEGATTADSQPVRSVVAAARHLRGGTWIGLLERLAVYSALLAHFPEGIAICLAVKGLARYPELQATTSGAAERFIIGTFVSVLLACGCAGLALWLCGPVLGRWA